VLQLLAFDLGTETLPVLALGREEAEPGIMNRPPRSRREGVIRRPMLLRAWLFLGLIAATLQMATTMTFLSMVVAQIGTAFAARTDRASQRSVGVFSNRPLLAGIALELALAAAIIYLPPLQHLLSTAALAPRLLLVTLPFPFIVWGADELRRYLVRRTDRRQHAAIAAGQNG
jgi:magnesium-transporting ATPase (P-type)